MAYDSSRDQVVVFGGDDGEQLNDTWTLSLSGTPQWTELLPTGQLLSGRCAPIVYDTARDRIVVFGGRDGSALGDVWALSLEGTQAWAQQSIDDPKPAARDGHAAAYDALRGRIVVFGGIDYSIVMDDTWTLTLDSPSTGVARSSIQSSDVLQPCYPNPFNPNVTIPFRIHNAGMVSIAIYDVSGSHVRTILRAWKASGAYTATWEGIDEAGQQVSSGVYFCRLETVESRAMQKFVLLK